MEIPTNNHFVFVTPHCEFMSNSHELRRAKKMKIRRRVRYVRQSSRVPS
jgi:hypothetical protein